MRHSNHPITAARNKNILQSFYYALCGLKAVFQRDIAFKREAFLTLIIVPLALMVGTTAMDKALLISSWFLVLIIETINSSIETAVDRISLEIHPLSKKIKDMSAAAVLLSIVNMVIVWLLMLASYLG